MEAPWAMPGGHPARLAHMLDSTRQNVMGERWVLYGGTRGERRSGRGTVYRLGLKGRTMETEGPRGHGISYPAMVRFSTSESDSGWSLVLGGPPKPERDRQQSRGAWGTSPATTMLRIPANGQDRSGCAGVETQHAVNHLGSFRKSSSRVIAVPCIVLATQGQLKKIQQ
jgi:uncharacterized repeat protein (TIGR03803 family)